MIELSKHTVKSYLSTLIPVYLKILNCLQSEYSGHLSWPEGLLKIKSNLKINNYVDLYNDEKILVNTFVYGVLTLSQLNGLKTRDKALIQGELTNQALELIQEVCDLGPEMFLAELEEIPSIFDINSLDQEFEQLSENEKQHLVIRQQCLISSMLAGFHNYLSIMVHGEKLTVLIQKAMKGDDASFLKALKIDKNLQFDHPYFKDKISKATLQADKIFCKEVNSILNKPNAIGRVRYPAIYIVFAFLDMLNHLDKLKAREILDLCESFNIYELGQSPLDEISLNKLRIDYKKKNFVT